MTKKEEAIEKAKAKRKQLDARIKAMEKSVKEADRKKRTKRLIQIGAEVEHYAGCEIKNMDSFVCYLKKFGYAIANTQKEVTTSSSPEDALPTDDDLPDFPF